MIEYEPKINLGESQHSVVCNQENYFSHSGHFRIGITTFKKQKLSEFTQRFKAAGVPKGFLSLIITTNTDLILTIFGMQVPLLLGQ